MAWAVQRGELSHDETHKAEHWLASSGDSEPANPCQVYCNGYAIKTGHD